MTIELKCGQCGRPLRLKPELAGRKIKCPQCQAVVAVPAASAPAAAPPAAPAPPTATAPPTVARTPTPVRSDAAAATLPPDFKPAEPRWHAKIDESLYGPMTRSELDLWVTNNRLDADCQVLLEGSDQWQWATDLYPQLESAPEPAPAADRAACAPASALTPVPPASPTGAATTRPRFRTDDTIPPAREPQARKSDEEFAAEPSDRRWITTFLLAFFLGSLGIHRFYLGRVTTGLAMLFTLGGLFVWQIVDLVWIALERLPDHLGRPLRK